MSGAAKETIWDAPSEALPPVLQSTAIVAAARKPAAAVAIVPTDQITRAGVGDENFGLLFQPVTPDRARWIIAAAAQGDLAAQDELFGLMLDTWPRLAKASEELKSAVQRLRWNVTPAARKNAEPTKTAQDYADTVDDSIRGWMPDPATAELGFEPSVGALVEGRVRGLALVELLWQSTARGIFPRAGLPVAPKWYGWNRDGTRLGLISTLADSMNPGRALHAWRPFPPDKFLIATHGIRRGAIGATALLRPLVPYWVGRTYGWQWLLKTAQLFGTPFRWATYEAGRDDVAKEVAKMLANLGSAGWAAFPEGTTLEWKEAVTNAQGNPQVVVQEMADQACDLLLLGQVLSSTSQPSGLGSSTAQLHGQVRAEVLASVAAWVADVLSYQLAPAVIRANYGTAVDPAEMPVLKPDLDQPEDPKAMAERDEVLTRMGMKLPAKWAHERHGVPEPEGGEAVIEAPAPASPFGFPGQPSRGSRPGTQDPAGTAPAKSPQNAEGDRPAVETPVSAQTPPRGAAEGLHRAPEVLVKATADDFSEVRGRMATILRRISDPSADLAAAIEDGLRLLDEAGPAALKGDALARELEAALQRSVIEGAASALPKKTTSP